MQQFAFEQNVVPKKAAAALGLKPGSRVLFFAGGAGDWAACLANEGIKVRYTDISGEVVEKVRAKFPGSFQGIKQADAMQLPEKKTNERMVSFEPVPLYRSWFVLFLLRALALSPGVTIAQSSYAWPRPEIEIAFIAGMYPIGRSSKVVFVEGRRAGKKRQGRRAIRIYSLEAKPEIRKLIWNDCGKILGLIGATPRHDDVVKWIISMQKKGAGGKNSAGRMGRIVSFMMAREQKGGLLPPLPGPYRSKRMRLKLFPEG